MPACARRHKGPMSHVYSTSRAALPESHWVSRPWKGSPCGFASITPRCLAIHVEQVVDSAMRREQNELPYGYASGSLKVLRANTESRVL